MGPVREGTTVLFPSRRSFLRSLSRSALVLSFENVIALARPLFGRPRLAVTQQTPAPSPTSVPTPTPSAKPGDLGVSFINVAKEAGLNVKTLFGGEHKNKYLLETTGCGVAFYDY